MDFLSLAVYFMTAINKRVFLTRKKNKIGKGSNNYHKELFGVTINLLSYMLKPD